MADENLYRNQQQTADNFVDTSDPQPVLKRNSERVRMYERNVLHKTRDTSTDTIWGRFTWGAANWDNTYDNDFEVASATSKDNTFIDDFAFTTYADENITTADLSTQYQVDIASGENYTSIEFYKDDDTTVTTVTLTNTDTLSGLEIQIRTDQQSWTTITSGTPLTLTAPALWIKYRVIGTGGTGWPTAWGTWGSAGSGSGTLTNMRIEYN